MFLFKNEKWKSFLFIFLFIIQEILSQLYKSISLLDLWLSWSAKLSKLIVLVCLWPEFSIQIFWSLREQNASLDSMNTTFHSCSFKINMTWAAGNYKYYLSLKKKIYIYTYAAMAYHRGLKRTEKGYTIPCSVAFL